MMLFYILKNVTLGILIPRNMMLDKDVELGTQNKT